MIIFDVKTTLLLEVYLPDVSNFANNVINCSKAAQK